MLYIKQHYLIIFQLLTVEKSKKQNSPQRGNGCPPQADGVFPSTS